MFRRIAVRPWYLAGSEWARVGIPNCRECGRSYDQCGSPVLPVPGLDYGTQWNTQVNCYDDCSGSTSSKVSGHCPGATQFPMGSDAAPFSGMAWRRMLATSCDAV